MYSLRVAAAEALGVHGRVDGGSVVVSFAPCACLRRAAVPALTVRSFSAVIVRADRLQAPVAMAASTATMLTVSAQPRAIECRLLAMLLLSGLLLAASLCFSSDRLSYSACPPLPVFYSFLFVQTSSRASSVAVSGYKYKHIGGECGILIQGKRRDGTSAHWPC